MMQADLFFKGSKVFQTISSCYIFAISFFLRKTGNQRLSGNPEPGEGKETHLTLCKVGRGSRRLSSPIFCPKQDQLQQAALDHDQLGGKYLQRCRLQISPCSLFLYLTSMTTPPPQLFLRLKWNSLYFSLYPLCPFIKSLVQFLLHSFIRYLYTDTITPEPSSLKAVSSLPLWVWCPCSTFMNFCFTFSSMSMSLS